MQRIQVYKIIVYSKDLVLLLKNNINLELEYLLILKKLKRFLRSFQRQIWNDCFNRNNFIDKGKNNKLKFDNCIASSVQALVHGNMNVIYVGENTLIRDVNIDIKGSGNTIRIGKNCRITNTEFWIKGEGCIIELKDQIYIRSAHIACGGNSNLIKVGNDCLIAYNVEIRNNDSHKIYDLISNELLNNPKDILISDKVWIGGNSVIMKGVEIGRQSVIGGGSIVTKNVDNNCVYAGIPAKKIKSNIYWEA